MAVKVKIVLEIRRKPSVKVSHQAILLVGGHTGGSDRLPVKPRHRTNRRSSASYAAMAGGASDEVSGPASPWQSIAT